MPAELNPVEPVWSHLKRSLANLTKQNIAQLTALVKTRLKRMQYRPGLLASAGLDLTAFCNPTIEDVLADSLSIDCQPLASLLVAGCPTVTAQSTVAALEDSARSPRRLAAVIRLSAHLPAPLLVGARLAVRRPRRPLLSVFSIAVAASGLMAVLVLHATSGARPSVPDWPRRPPESRSCS